MPRANVTSLLESAAQYRIREKSRRIRAMIQASSPDQAIFQLIGEALGYRKNQTPMAILAQRNPVKNLLKSKASEREAQLFGMSGFIDAEHQKTSHKESSKTTQYRKELWAHWWKIRSGNEIVSKDRQIPWATSGSRPLNHPQRRIAALAAFLNHWKLFRGLWESPCEKLVSNWVNSCEKLSHPFWDHQYTLSSKASPKPLRLIGQERARDMLGNAVFPLIMSRDPAYWETYLRLRGCGENQKLRRALLRLFGDCPETQKPYRKFFYQQQGLLQIFQDFCLVDTSACQECPFPEQIQQWD